MKRLSKIVTQLIVLIMLVGIMKNNLIYIVYQCDESLFINLFCENKSRPQLKCNGQCQLTKMAEEQREKEASAVLKQLQTEQLYWHQQHCFTIKKKALVLFDYEKKIDYYNHPYFFVYVQKFIKPPEYA